MESRFCNFSVDFVLVKNLAVCDFGFLNFGFLGFGFCNFSVDNVLGKTWPFVILDPSTATTTWHKLNLCKF